MSQTFWPTDQAKFILAFSKGMFIIQVIFIQFSYSFHIDGYYPNGLQVIPKEKIIVRAKVIQKHAVVLGP